MAKNNITVTVELCKEDRDRLDALLTAVQGIGTPYNVPAPETPQKAPETPDTTTEDNTQPEHETPTEATAEAAKPVTHADVQKRVVELSAAGHKAQVREIIKKFAPKVSAIPEDDLADVWTLLDALERHMEANQ